MNYQKMEILEVVMAIIVVNGAFLACQYYDEIKAVIQAAGGAIRNAILWPWRLWKNHREKKQIERTWMDYINKHKMEISTSLMKIAMQEMTCKKFTTKEALKGAERMAEMMRKTGICTEDIKNVEGRKMASIYIKMKNGEMKEFKHEGRAGGSYTKSIRYEGAFAIVRDEWGDETAIPAADIEEVRTKQERYW